MTKEVIQNTENNLETLNDNYIQKEKIRNLVSGIYDIQKLRISTGNRIISSFNIQMGQKPSKSLDELDDNTKTLINKLRKEYSRITDAYVSKSYISKNKTNDKVEEKLVNIGKNAGIEKVINAMVSDSNSDITLIRSKIDYELTSTYVDLLETEAKMTRLISKEVSKHPMWDAFFKDVTGCGPLMSAVCLAYFDPYKARHVSGFWKYAGLDTVYVTDDSGKQVRQGRSRQHTEMYEYVAKDGTIKQKKGLTFNPEVKTKLVGVLSSSFLKQPGCKYEQIYRDYCNRLDNRIDSDKLTQMHKHRMANRYMIKQFLRDMWVAWRKIEGLDITEPYEVAVLGRKPHKYNYNHMEASTVHNLTI